MDSGLARRRRLAAFPYYRIAPFVSWYVSKLGFFALSSADRRARGHYNRESRKPYDTTGRLFFACNLQARTPAGPSRRRSGGGVITVSLFLKCSHLHAMLRAWERSISLCAKGAAR